MNALPGEQLNQRAKRMLDQLSSANCGVQLEIANSLWANKDKPMRAQFVSDSMKSYSARAAALDFADPAAPGQINAWVNHCTHGKIPTVVQSLDQSGAAVLLDAVYFKGMWDNKFDKEGTKEKPFKLASGEKILHPRMIREGQFKYSETRDFQLVALPYQGNDVTAHVLLPKRSLAGFVRQLSLASWRGWVSDCDLREGTLELPRFKFDNDYDLIPMLKSLGITKAFTDAADFRRLGDKLYVGQAAHKTFVKVNEEGTEAAAVTTIYALTLGIEPPHKEPPPFKMIVDRPFLFVILEDTTGAILFIGAINDPR